MKVEWEKFLAAISSTTSHVKLIVYFIDFLYTCLFVRLLLLSLRFFFPLFIFALSLHGDTLPPLPIHSTHQRRVWEDTASSSSQRADEVTSPAESKQGRLHRRCKIIFTLPTRHRTPVIPFYNTLELFQLHAWRSIILPVFFIHIATYLYLQPVPEVWLCPLIVPPHGLASVHVTTP